MRVQRTVSSSISCDSAGPPPFTIAVTLTQATSEVAIPIAWEFTIVRGQTTTADPDRAAHAVCGCTMSLWAPLGGPPATITLFPSRFNHLPLVKM